MPNSSPTTSADLPLWSQFWTASRLKVSSNFRRSGTDVCFMNLSFHCSPDSLSVKSRYPQVITAILVRIHARNVRSLARYSVAFLSSGNGVRKVSCTIDAKTFRHHKVLPHLVNRP